MNPDKSNKNNSSIPEDDLNNIPELDLNEQLSFDPNLMGMDETFSDEMNQYLSDTVSDSFDTNTTKASVSTEDDLNPVDPYGLGSNDVYDEPINIDDLVGMDNSAVQSIDPITDTNILNDANSVAYGNTDEEEIPFNSNMEIGAPLNDELNQDLVTDSNVDSNAFVPEVPVQEPNDFASGVSVQESNDFVPGVPADDLNNSNVQDTFDASSVPMDDLGIPEVSSDLLSSFDSPSSDVQDFNPDMGDYVQEVPNDNNYDTNNVNYDANTSYDQNLNNDTTNYGYDQNNTGYDQNAGYGYDQNMNYDANTNYDQNSNYVDLNQPMDMNQNYDYNQTGYDSYNTQGYDANYNAGYDMPSQDYNPNPYGTAGVNQMNDSQGYNPPDVNSQGVAYNNSNFAEPNFGGIPNQDTQNPPSSEEVLKGPKQKEKKTKTKKKGGIGKVFLVLFVLLLIGGCCYGGYYYYTNYMNKNTAASNKQIFFNSIVNSNVMDLLDFSNTNQINDRVKEESHTSKMEISASTSLDELKKSLGERGIDLSKAKILYNYTVNREDEKAIGDIKINYSDNDIYKYEEVKNKNYKAMRTEGVTDKYLVNDGSNIRANQIFEDYRDILSIIPDFPKNEASQNYLSLVNNLKIGDKDSKEALLKYAKIYMNALPDANFESVKEVKIQGINGSVGGVKLSINNKEALDALNEVAKAMKEDKDLLALIVSDEDEDNTMQATPYNIPVFVNEDESNIQTQPEEVTTSPDTVVNTYTENPAVTEDNVQPVEGEASNLNASLEMDVTTDLTNIPLVSNTNSSLDSDFMDLSISSKSNFKFVSDILGCLLTGTRTAYSEDEIVKALESEIKDYEENYKPSNEDLESIEITSYVKDDKAQKIRIKKSGTNIDVDFGYGETQSIKLTVLDNSFDSIVDMVPMVTGSALNKVEGTLDDALEVDEAALNARASTNYTTSTQTIDNTVTNSNTAGTLQGNTTAPNLAPDLSVPQNTAPTDNTATTVENATPTETTTEDLGDETTVTTVTNTEASNHNAGLVEGEEAAPVAEDEVAETPVVDQAPSDIETTNTAQMNDQTISSEILNMDMGDEDTNIVGNSTKEPEKEPTNGFAITIERSGQDVSEKKNVSVQVIRDNVSYCKLSIYTSRNGISTSKEIKNNYTITFNNQEGEVSLKISNTISFDISKTEFPNFTTDNAIFVDKMSDGEIAELKVAVDKASQQVLMQIKKNLNLIDTANAPVEVEQPVTVPEPENRITLEQAQDALVNAISIYMGEVQARGEEFSLGRLENFTIPNHEFSAVVNGEIAIIEMDGYRFHLDSTYNLSAE